MNITSTQGALRDVTQYPANILRHHEGVVRVPVTYKRVWDDGFGARGWKVDATIGDPEIIASTRETGLKINTSVFIHDILDHFLSGFGVSGHRSEAMALVQLSKRTGSDPSSDYQQLVREDILQGRVNGEALIDFLPEQLAAMIPEDAAMTDREVVAYLRESLGEKRLVKLLVDRFYQLGRAGENHADENWKLLGLDTNKRTDIGRALQALLEVIDLAVEQLEIEELHGILNIDNEHVAFFITDGDIIESIDGVSLRVNNCVVT